MARPVLRSLKKTIPIIGLIMLSLTHAGLAQGPSFNWAFRIGGTGASSIGQSVDVDAVGNVYTAGRFTGTVDFDPGPGTVNLTSVGSVDAFVTKMGPSGNLIWAKRVGGTQDELIYSNAVDGSGNVYLTGSFQGTADFDPGPGVFSLTASPAFTDDIFILKLNPDGDFVWAKRIGSSGFDFGQSIAVGPSGVVTTGSFEGTVDFDPGAGTASLVAPAGQGEIFILKLDENGNFVWARRMGGNNGDGGKSIALDAAENVYSTGFFRGTADFDPGAGTNNLTSAGSADIFVSKLDASGNFIWAKGMGGSGFDEGAGIKVDIAGDVYTTGDFEGTADFDPGTGTNNLVSAGSNDSFVSKLDASGNFVWAKRIGGTIDDQSTSLGLDGAGNVYTAGMFESTVDFDPGPGTFNITSLGSTDVFITKLDPLGNFAWAVAFGGPSGQELNGIHVNAAGGVYSTGHFSSTVDFDPGAGVSNLTAVGTRDIFISKLSQAPVPPTIASFTPTSGPVGTSVTINGTNYSSVPNNNIVYFGATRAVVTAASATQLTVTVPSGATYQPISVTVAGATGFSSSPFLVTFPDGGNITSCAFAPKVDFVAGTSPNDVAIGDLDGDGKSEMVITNRGSDNISIFRNTTATGTINTASFAAAMNITTNDDPYGVALGDLDGDGKMDIVVSNYLDNNVSVFRNTSTPGALSFAPKVDFTSDIGPYVVRIGDLDVDGKPDIAVTNFNGGFSISLFRNTSTPGVIDAGSFAARVDLPSSDNFPYGLAIGDLDADGKPELAVTNYISSSVSLYRNISTPGSITTGSFATPFAYTVQASPLGVAIGDLDADGKPEVSVANYASGSVTVLKNSTTSGAFTAASFAAGVHFTTDANPENVAIDDLTGDGKPDLVTGNQFGPSVSVLQNTTSGSISFGAFVEFPALFNTRLAAIGDLDGDAKPDIAVASAGSGSVSVLRNTVASQPSVSGFSPSSGPIGSSVIITGSGFSSSPVNNIVYFGATRAVVTAATTTQLTVTVPDGATYEPISVLVGCLTAYSAQPFVVTFAGTGIIDASTFAAKVDFTTGSTPADIAFGDLDGDGKPDVTTINDGGGNVSIFRNTGVPGGVSFAASTTAAAGASPQSIEIGDMDGDGKLDLVTVSDGSTQVSVHRNTSTIGTISFAARVSATTGTLPVSLAIGEIDGDGRPDIAVVNRTSGTVSVFRNTSSPGFVSLAPKIDLTISSGLNGVAIADIDGDGKLEILAANRTASTVSIFRNISTVGAIAFDPSVVLTSGTGANGVAVGDLDVDGKPDVAVANYTARTVSVFRNISTPGSITTGSFDPIVSFTNSATNNPTYVAIGDVNGDNKPDLLVGNDNGTLIQVHKNTSSPGSIAVGSFAAPVAYTTGTRPSNVNMIDLDGDGKPDLAASNASSASFSVLRNAGSSCIPSQQRAALIALYNSTDGANWTNNTNWLSGDENSWYGVTITGCNVTAISLDANNLSGTLPPELADLPELASLSLASNQLYGTLPPEVGDLDLQVLLDLHSNQLFGSIPPEIGNMTSLVSLQLWDNQLDSAIPIEIGGLVSLQDLNLSQNVFSGALPATIGSLGNLRIMNLSQNQLDNDLPTTIGNLLALEELYLNNNLFTNSMPTEVAALPGLRIVDISSNLFTVMRAFTSTALTDLSVQQNSLDFGDLELNIGVTNYSYDPQAKLPPGGVLTFIPGGTLTIPFTTPGTGNSYQWYEGANLLVGQTSPTLVRPGMTLADAGFYYVEVTSSVVPGITLTSRNYQVTSDPCGPGGPDGDNDPSFVPDIGGTDTGNTAVGIQSTGKVIVAGQGNVYMSTNVDGIFRLNPDGTFDTSFPVSYSPGVSANQLIVQPDDKILTYANTAEVWRLNSDGTDDIAFNSNSPDYYNAYIFALGLQPDGKILVAVSEDSNPAEIYRLNADGTPDPSFTGPTGIDPSVIRVQPDGKILLGGNFMGGVMRLNANGSFDTSFNENDADGPVYDIAVQPDGKIILVGAFESFNDVPHYKLVRLNSDGSTDPTFEALGVTDLLEAGTAPYSVLLQSDGKIVLAGDFDNVNGTTRPDIVRLNPDGTVDCTFDTQAGSDMLIFDAALAPDGRIVIVGDFNNYNGATRDGIARVLNGIAVAGVPTITSFSPASGPIGTAVIITGTNFSTSPSSNLVYFGATRATVTAALATQLTVTVPVGATHHPITVSVGGLTAHAPKPFVLTFAGGGAIDNCSFAPSVTIGSVPGFNRSAFADIDGDGKPDLIIPESANNQLSIFRNISVAGTIVPGSFAPKVTFATVNTPLSVAIGDIDGDGLRDLAVINYISQKLSLFKNTSSAGTISLGPRVDITIPDFSHDVSIADMDGDGKQDLAITTSFNGLIVYRNVGTPGVINATTFASGTSFGTGPNAYPFVLGDLDGDGKLDAAVPNGNNYTVSLLRNTSTSGTVSFAPQVVLTTAAGSPAPGGGAVYTALGDLDGDGKLDLAATTNTVNITSLYRNTSVPGTLSFDPKFDLSNTAVANTPALNDLDGDGKIELVTDYGNTGIAVYKNVSTPGSINAASFSAPIVLTRAAASIILLGDVDGDGRNDVITTSATIQAFRNLIGTLTPPTISGFTPSSGTVSTSVTITGSNFITPFTTSVDFNGTNAPIIDLQPTSIIVSVPAGATTGPIQVIVGCNTVNSSTNFSVCTPPSAPGTVPNSRCGGGTVVLGATGTTDGNYRWYTVSSGGTAISGEVNSNYTTPVITASTTYYVSIDNGICEGPRSAVTATILTPPADPTPIPGARCGSGVVSLTAAGGSPGLYRWYDSGVLIGGEVNDTYVTPVILATTVYEVSIHDGLCESNRIAIAATVNTIPTLPVVPNVSRCDAGTVLLSASGATGTEAYRWYDLPSGGTLLASTATYTTVVLTATTPYYVSKIETGTLCEGSRTTVQAIVNTSPAPPATTGNSGCSGTTISLSASGASPGEYRWYTTSSGGTAIVGALNDTFITPVLTTTTTFHAAINNGTCESTRTPVAATVLPLPTSPVPTPATGCQPSASLTLTASGGSPGEYRWYTTPTGGSPLVGETNSTYVTPALSSSTTYYVSINNSICESPRISVLAEIRSCTPIIATVSSTATIGASTSINIAPLVTIISDPIDIASIKIITPPLSGAVATIINGVLEVDYSSVPFAGTDQLTIEACDIAGHCAQQVVTIEVVGDITVFNALSPNGDGKNDFFFIQFIDALPGTQQNKVTILNRWGTVVFETTNYDNTSNVFKGLSDSGAELPTGTYYYVLEFSSGAAKRTGFISLRK